MRDRWERWIRVPCAAAIASGVFVCAASTSHAAGLEPAGINLGGTSFYDGFGRNEEGFVYLAYGQYAFANSIREDDGKPNMIFVSPKIDVYTFINQLVYILPEPLFNNSAHLGINFLLPFVAFNTSFASTGIQLQDNGAGIGDLTFGPLLQFRPVEAQGRPVFSNRIELDLIAPIGKYDPTKDLNQGSNFASFNPYWAITVLPLAGLEMSARFYYLFNFWNHAPAGSMQGNPLIYPGLSPNITTGQAGQAVWLNFAASYAIFGPLHIGVNGYYFAQFTSDNYKLSNGTQSSEAAVDTGRAKFLAIGPGGMWDVDEQNKVYVNFYFETNVRNWPQSNVLNLHYIHSF